MRLTPTARKAQLLRAALDLAHRGHYQRVTRAAVAARAGVADSLVSHYLGDVAAMRRAIMRAAVREGWRRVIAQGVMARDRVALHAQRRAM